jgi:hypothetical protein
LTCFGVTCQARGVVGQRLQSREPRPLRFGNTKQDKPHDLALGAAQAACLILIRSDNVPRLRAVAARLAEGPKVSLEVYDSALSSRPSSLFSDSSADGDDEARPRSAQVARFTQII